MPLNRVSFTPDRYAHRINIALSDPRPSLVFGIVAATGTHIEPFVEVLSALLRRYGYEPVSIRLTDLLLEPGSITWSDEGLR